MAEFIVHIDTDNAAGGRDGSSGNPYDGIVEALANTTFTRGNTYVFRGKGTAIDDVNSSTGEGIDYSGISGTGDFGVTVESWEGETDGRYTGKDNISPSHWRITNTNTTANAPIFFVVGDGNTADANDITFQFLQLINDASSVTKHIEVRGGVRGTVRVLQNAFKAGTTGTFSRPVRVDAAADSFTLEVKNNLFIGVSGNGVSSINLNDGNTTLIARNNTFVYDTGVGEDSIDDVSGDSLDVQMCVFRALSGGSSIEIDSAGTPTKDWNASQTSADRGANGWATTGADFVSFGVADTSDNSPSASQTNPWADTGRGNNDDSEIPLIDKTGAVRDPADTSAGCFARADEDAGLTLTAALFADGDTFFASTVAPQAVTLAPSLFVDGDTFPVATVETQTDLVATLLDDTDAFFTAVITATRDLAATLFVDPDAFGAHTISAGNALVATLFTDTDTFPAHTVAPGALTLTAALFADPDTFPAHTLSVGAADLVASLFADTDVFFGPVISTGLTVSPGLYVDPETFPAQTVQPGAVNLIGSLFADPDTFSAHDITSGINLAALLYVDPDTFPAQTVAPGDVTLIGSTYLDADTFPAPVVAQELFLTGTLYIDGDVFNVHQVVVGDLVTLPLPGPPFAVVDRTVAGAIVDRTVAAKILEG